MKTVTVITAPDCEYGFSLAGIKHYAVEDAIAEETLRRAVSAGNTGLVIVDERVMKALDEERLREIQRGWAGIVLILPSPERQDASGEDYAMRLIRRAIGYHVRVKT